ncbi:putative lipoprotein [Spiroplasma kunkelii CR2-3x]|uniref:Putative lipoprotein n=1 Tax=Spiroplasma kunkelii CR2-3x TaxID=273035 RepID=A0A0K2JGF2_SPIKU|nr:lipoprotein [Spiroplasma kunkelii]ALA97513.1 putative lipoprotein [Spiroplasma kunkelii CR2-3x]
MKKWLNLFGAITLLGTSATSLVACDKTQEYTPEELAKLKEENKINTDNQEIKDNLEWIAPQEKQFNTVDNKWYYVVWKGQNWNISKFKYDKWWNKISKNLETKFKDLYYIDEDEYLYSWKKFPQFIKSVYRWNLDTQEPDLIIDDNGNIKINGE